MKSISRQDVVRTYRMYAPFYDRVFGAVLEPGRRALSASIDRLQPAALLEVGVGTGLMLSRYPPATQVTGIDISADMLDIARHRAAKLGDRDIRLDVMDAEAMTFADGSFDCVTMPYILSVTPNPGLVIAEIRRVCRKGGTILILNHFSGSPFWHLLERAAEPLAARIGFRSAFSFEEQIRGHDWDVQSVQPVNLLGLSKLIEIRNG